MLLFLEGNDFLLDLQKELYSDLDRVVVILFKLSYREYFKKVYPFLLMQLDLGCTVELYLDGVFSKCAFDGFVRPLFWDKKSRMRSQRRVLLREKALNNLIKKGAKVRYFNEPKNFIFKNILTFVGRDHRKFFYIQKKDGTSVSYFGSLNLDKKKSYDYMVKSLNSSLNEELLSRNISVWNTPRQGDVSIQLDKYNLDGEIIIDSGRGSSLIYAKSIDLIKRAHKNIILLSPLPTEPHLLFYLVISSIRGVRVKVLISNVFEWYNAGISLYAAYLFSYIVTKIFGIQLNFVSTHYSHSKVLLVDDCVVVGSHNFSFVGVISRTVEMSLFTKDRGIVNGVKNLIDFLTPVD